MPACSDCIYLVNKQCLLLGRRETSLIRPCVIAAVIEQSAEIRPGDKILEIGCGKAFWVEQIVYRRGGKWKGVDPADPDQNESVRFNRFPYRVGDMKFGEESFDGVVGVSTIEHWQEFGDTIAGGLSEIHRVLKPGGWLLITCPMYVHGAKEFVIGNRDKILSYFDKNTWNVSVEDWRRDHRPLPRYAGWIGRQQRKQRIRWMEEAHPDASKLSSYQMIVTARKK